METGELLSNLALGFSVAVSLQNLFWCLMGAIIGTAIGVLPGVGPVATMALLLPATYFLPAEGASDKALALFSFPSLAAYEQYRGLFGEHPDFVAADRIRDESGCVLRYERTFMRPLLPGDTGS